MLAAIGSPVEGSDCGVTPPLPLTLVPADGEAAALPVAPDEPEVAAPELLPEAPVEVPAPVLPGLVVAAPTCVEEPPLAEVPVVALPLGLVVVTPFPSVVPDGVLAFAPVLAPPLAEAPPVADVPGETLALAPAPVFVLPLALVPADVLLLVPVLDVPLVPGAGCTDELVPPVQSPLLFVEPQFVLPLEDDPEVAAPLPLGDVVLPDDEPEVAVPLPLGEVVLLVPGEVVGFDPLVAVDDDDGEVLSGPSAKATPPALTIRLEPSSPTAASRSSLSCMFPPS